MKLNELLKQYNVNIMSFPAFKGLEEFCNKEGKVVNLCTLPAELLLQQGISEYYAPVIPRGSIFNTAQEIMDADLDVNQYRIVEVESEDVEYCDTVIVTRHKATIDIIKEKFNCVTKVLTGNVTAEDIQGRNVVGVLPPNLICKCNSYIAMSIKDYNATEGDLTKEQIEDRLIMGRPIRLINVTGHNDLIKEFLESTLSILKEKDISCFKNLYYEDQLRIVDGYYNRLLFQFFTRKRSSGYQSAVLLDNVYGIRSIMYSYWVYDPCYDYEDMTISYWTDESEDGYIVEELSVDLINKLLSRAL